MRMYFNINEGGELALKQLLLHRFIRSDFQKENYQKSEAFSQYANSTLTHKIFPNVG